MDERLEKIRRFEANVTDFDTYINDRIRATKAKNVIENVSNKSYEQYGLEPNEFIPASCIEYIVSNIYNFDKRYSLALDKIGRLRIPLENADTNLFDEILKIANEWKEDNNIDDELFEIHIEEIFDV